MHYKKKNIEIFGAWSITSHRIVGIILCVQWEDLSKTILVAKIHSN